MDTPEIPVLDINSVLIVDDNEIDIYIAKKILRRKSAVKQIFSETSVQSAIHFLKKESILPEYILLDFNMPCKDGLDFLDEYEKLEERIRKSTKVILISAYVDYLEERLEKVKSHPLLSGFVQKPFTLEGLAQAVMTIAPLLITQPLNIS